MTHAMRWRLRKERKAKDSYQRKKNTKLKRAVFIRNCGLFIDPQRTWLGASPDGIVTDSKTGQELCLEVKCSYKHRDRLVEDACREDRDFCLEIREGNRQRPSYRLKKTHPYFTQVQCQMAVTGLQEADFVVYTNRETVFVPVRFDPDLWEDTVSKLEEFYRDAVLPHLNEPQQEEAATVLLEL